MADENPNGAAPDASPRVPEFLPQVVNCKAEEDSVVRDFATAEGVALIAFIAPQVPVRISPIEEARAVIGLVDEFGVEALVGELQRAQVDRAYLLVNSPGGAMDSSYKIARAIRTALKEITTFVPHVAASGGTLLALMGDEIVMGPMSHLTPLDVQTLYRETRVSAASGRRFYNRARTWFERRTPEETPYPQRALTDKMDPYVMEQWEGTQGAMLDYTREILELSGYDPEVSGGIATELVWGYPIHPYVINADKAGKLGLRVKDSSQFPQTWDVMRHWLGDYLIERQATHCIRFVLPETGTARKAVAAKRSTARAPRANPTRRPTVKSKSVRKTKSRVASRRKR